ncbi:hypothetical protein DV515_00016405 [Chloebia gouldiae]|uniref:Uncharacterized protein n=1 Tax=Chloebia gouldiae TaxID=44316 RepID=A0A3L8RU11_CHLGU|nr:hypothetical protein DV515_00016405 [Chloebia gouldiae]
MGCCCRDVVESKVSLFLGSSGLSPEESERLTAQPEAEPRPRSPPAPRRERGPSPSEPRAAPAAAGRSGEEGREEPRPKAARPAQASPERRAARAGERDGAHGETLPQKRPGAAGQRAEEQRRPGLAQEAPGTESLGAPSKPKSPEAAGGAAKAQSPAAAPATPEEQREEKEREKKEQEKKPPASEAMQVGLEAHKRKSEGREEAPGSPEKKPRVAEPCPQQPQAFRRQPFPGAGAAAPRVPPLKVSPRGRSRGRASPGGSPSCGFSAEEGPRSPARPTRATGRDGSCRARLQTGRAAGALRGPGDKGGRPESSSLAAGDTRARGASAMRAPLQPARTPG